MSGVYVTCLDGTTEFHPINMCACGNTIKLITKPKEKDGIVINVYRDISRRSNKMVGYRVEAQESRLQVKFNSA